MKVCIRHGKEASFDHHTHTHVCVCDGGKAELVVVFCCPPLSHSFGWWCEMLMCVELLCAGSRATCPLHLCFSPAQKVIISPRHDRGWSMNGNGEWTCECTINGWIRRVFLLASTFPKGHIKDSPHLLELYKQKMLYVCCSSKCGTCKEDHFWPPLYRAKQRIMVI